MKNSQKQESGVVNKMTEPDAIDLVGLPSHGIILEEICQEENIKIRWLSNNWVALLEKNGVKRYVSGYKFGLDSHAVGEIMDDKFALYDVLREQGLPVIPHRLLYAESCHGDFTQEKKSREYIMEFVREYSWPIIIKPNNGTGGKGVYRVERADELDKTLDEVFEKSYSASMCPFCQLKTEYRVVWLKNEPRLVYGKHPQQSEDGENWKFNLKCGAQAEKVPEGALKSRLVNLAKRAAEAINLHFGSIDIAELEDGRLVIMEMNSGVMIKRYLRQHPEDRDLVKRIYADAVREMFEI